MATSSPPSARRATSFSRRAKPRLHALAPFLLFLVALLPRLAALGRYVTPDELNWVYRSIGLRQALATATWADTIQSGHPGVTTTWLGTIAIHLQQWLHPASRSDLAWLGDLYWLTPDNIAAYRHLYTFLDGARLGVALLSSLCLVFIYLVARDVLGERAALVGAAFLALDPFFAGLSGLLHVDALLATFMLLALLLALRTAASRRGRDGFFAGVATALAILTKTPGVILLAFVPAVLLVGPLVARLRRAADAPPLPVRPLLSWAAGLVATGLLLLPALWTDPLHVWRTFVGLSGQFAGAADRPVFFLGQMVLDPGLLFYPVATLFRLSPAATIGLVVAVGVGLRAGRTAPGLTNVGWLLLFAFLYGVAISFVAMKFDRYSLSALVALTLIAGWGVGHLRAGPGYAGRYAGPGFVLLQGLFLLLALPYPLTAYNWIAGGSAVAKYVLPAGWGEDAGVAARWLAAHVENPGKTTLFTTNTTGTAPFYPGPILRQQPAYLSQLQAEDYLLLLTQDRQGGAPMMNASYRQQTVRVTGALEAQFYRGLAAADFGVPALTWQPQPYRFGNSLHLRKAGVAILPFPEESLVTMQWEPVPAATLDPSYQMQVQLVDDAGTIRVQREVPLLNDADRPPATWATGVLQNSSVTFAIPPDLPPDDYEIAVRVFDAGGKQLGVFDGEGRFRGVAAVLSTVAVSPPAAQPVLAIPHEVSDAQPLLGHGDLPPTAGSGEPLTLDLWWQRPPDQVDTLALHLGGAVPTTTVTTAGWRADQGYHIRPRWRLPVTLAPGTYPLALAATDATGQPLWPEPITLGTITVRASERTFTLPAGVDPLALQVGGLAYLQEVRAEVTDEHLLVHVTWQAQAATDTSYTTFLHLRDAAGAMVAQGDRPPGPATTTWVPGQVIAETYALPRPPDGDYAINLGLYDAASGMRLPLYDEEGSPLPGDQYVIEVRVP